MMLDVARHMPEKQLQANVVELAELLGWMVYHTYDSRKSAPGFPDLVMVKAPRVIIAELKTEKGHTTDAQDEWLSEFGRCEETSIYHASMVPTAQPVVSAFVWRPSDWLDGTIEGVLKR